MQISIAQAEIEEAIEKHVREQVAVREDQQVKIDLKATRGPEGYQAIIDIVSAVEEPAPKKASTRASHASPKSTGIKDAVAAAKVTKTPDPKAAEPAVAQTEDDAVEVAEAAVAEVEATPVVEAEVVAEPVAEAVEAEEAPAAAPRQSLFGNLKEVKNA
jgi:hypothetical protein